MVEIERRPVIFEISKFCVGLGIYIECGNSLSLSLSSAGAMIVGGPQSTAVPIGQSASFSCNVTGEPTPTILWQFNGQQITESSKYTVSTLTSGDVTRSMLTVSALLTSDSGTYSCYAENDHLNETASAMLTVQSKATLYHIVRNFGEVFNFRDLANLVKDSQI